MGLILYTDQSADHLLFICSQILSNIPLSQLPPCMSLPSFYIRMTASFDSSGRNEGPCSQPCRNQEHSLPGNMLLIKELAPQSSHMARFLLLAMCCNCRDFGTGSRIQNAGGNRQVSECTAHNCPRIKSNTELYHLLW